VAIQRERGAPGKWIRGIDRISAVTHDGGMGAILHIDMDAFYAAVEVRDHPELRGKPVVIGSPPDKRGVVSTASYEARQFGIRSAMPSRTAGKLCPHAVFLPVRMARYLEVSEQVMAIIESFTPIYEQLSVDEAFLDVAGVLRRWKTGEAVAIALKQRIRKQTGLTASVGVAPNKFLAKLASDLKKPDGLFVVPDEPDAIARFLAALPVSRIWGVGKVTEKRLHECGLRTIGDVQRIPRGTLASYVGEALAVHMQELAWGRDDRPVVTEHQAKSISSETTFDEDCTDAQVVRQVLVEQVEQVGRRLRRDGRKARVGHIRIRYEDFSTITRQQAFARPTHADRDLLRCATLLWEREHAARPVRLIGFGVSGLDGEEPLQGELNLGPFTREPELGKVERLDTVVDTLREQFGRDALKRGSALR
jgi:nucleotidyltransferase/DNA polymerase involved in DNA repair